MKTIPSPATGREMGAGVRRAPVLLTLILLAVSFDVAAQERTTAVWKERDFNFIYRSSNAIYTCSALKGRVASILLAVGARPDVKVRVDNCDEFVGPQDDPRDSWENPSDRYRPGAFGADRFRNDRTSGGQSAIVRIRVMTPVEVTPDVIEDLKKEKTRRELVARVTGDRSAILQATGEFPAEWQTITLSQKSVGLEPEECELLDQMSTTVFRELGLREVGSVSLCNPRHPSRIPPKLTVEALISTPWGANPAQEMPAAGEGDAPPSAPAASDPAASEPATPNPE